MALSAPVESEVWAGHRPGSPEYRRLLIVLFCAGIATFAQLYAPQAVLPEIARGLDVSAASAALVVSAATIGLAIAVLPWSAVADRIGRVRAMSIALAGATTLGLLSPFAPSFALLLLARILQGLMLGGVPAIAVAYLSEEVHSDHAAGAAGTYIAGTTVGGLTGRLVAGPVTEATSWHVGVLCVSCLCAIAALLFVVLAPPARHAPPGRGAGMLSLVAVNLRAPRQLALYAQGFLLMGGFVALYNYLGFRLTAVPFGLSQSLVSLVFIAYLAGTWSSPRAGALASRHGRRPVLLASIAVMIGGVALTLTGSLVVILAGLIIATGGFFGAHAVASGWTAQAAVTGTSQASSLYNFFYYAGSSLFGWLGGVFFSAAGWSGTAAMTIVLALIAASAAAVILGGGGAAPAH
jgi:predicted MFS family arabinose efflux permease